MHQTMGESHYRKWFRSVIKQLVLFTVSLMIAFALMGRVKGGWSIETVGWLALVWYLVLLLICDFLVFRGQGRIRTLLVVVTGAAITIEFPFTAIRKANYRAQFRIANGQSLEKVKVISLWNWWEVSAGELIPRCLAWRVPIRGVSAQRVFDCNSSRMLEADHPKWFRKEVLSIEYFVSDGEPFLNQRAVPIPKHKVVPKTAYILRSSRNNPQLPTVADGTNADWLLNFVDFGFCNTIQIESVDLSKQSWRHLLSSDYLSRLELRNTNVEALFMESNKTHEMLATVTLDNVPFVSRDAVLDLMDKCPNLRSLDLPYRLLEPSLIQKYVSENKTFAMSFLEAPCIVMLWKNEVHFLGYSFALHDHEIDFTDDTIQPLFSLFKRVRIYNCRLSAKDLFALSKWARLTHIEIADCTTAQVEYDKLGLDELQLTNGTIVDFDEANRWYLRSLFERQPPSLTITNYRK